MVKTVSAQELKQLKVMGVAYTLIDVREPHEAEIATLNGKLIPLGQISENLKDFDVEANKVIVYCRSGKRSEQAIRQIEKETGQKNLYNLEGGILEWADKIDNSITKY